MGGFVLFIFANAPPLSATCRVLAGAAEVRL
jgi:hypothetical protein